MSQFPWLFHSLKFSFDMSENKLTPVNCFHVPGTVLSIGSSLPRNGHNPHVTANQQYNALFTQRRLSFGNSFSRNFFFCAATTRQTSVNSLKFQTRVSLVRCLINKIVFKRIKNGGQHLIFCVLLSLVLACSSSSLLHRVEIDASGASASCSPLSFYFMLVPVQPWQQEQGGVKKKKKHSCKK